MFEWLFPNWTPAWVVAVLVGLRLLGNLGLTAAVRVAADDAATVTAAALTLTSTVLMVAVLRGDLGQTASYVEFLVQLSLLGIAAVAVARGDGKRMFTLLGRPTATARSVAAVAALLALSLLLVFIPLYGEATVAP
ncbi:hypothetical protein B4589_014660 [Halolamina sp. CBA1230]|uniref:hypothetical protein n=1 Tax=Halolamina sp. CBA1230 TaxID=1853690 RepID=UPI0009A1B2AF|nr:hypothetical protein [Halolamina sp. CBA1230]QKY21554.1 hypothetical protein B4589_014660 [Halolamina sp. CBA1230]